MEASKDQYEAIRHTSETVTGEARYVEVVLADADGETSLSRDTAAAFIRWTWVLGPITVKRAAGEGTAHEKANRLVAVYYGDLAKKERAETTTKDWGWEAQARRLLGLLPAEGPASMSTIMGWFWPGRTGNVTRKAIVGRLAGYRLDKIRAAADHHGITVGAVIEAADITREGLSQ